MSICVWRRGVIQKTHGERRSQLSPMLHSPCPVLSPVHRKKGRLRDEAAPYLPTRPPALSAVQRPTNRQSGRAEPIKETPVIFHLLMDRQLMMIL